MSSIPLQVDEEGRRGLFFPGSDGGGSGSIDWDERGLSWRMRKKGTVRGGDRNE